MKIIVTSGILILLVAGFFFAQSAYKKSTLQSPSQDSPTANNETVQEGVKDIPQTTVIAQNLDTPWGLVFLPALPPGRRGRPNKSILVTERQGKVRLIDGSGNLQSQVVHVFEQVKEVGEGGLLGITLHPNFSSNNYVYLYYTYRNNGANTFNRVVRMTYQNKQLKDERVILDNIPGASNHNGGRIKFGPDGYLYISTGDAQNPSQSQDTKSLAGKILRVTDEGKGPADNPFRSLVYSFGHRNSQGITWDKSGRLYEVEHGQSAQDEFNIIKKGKNYGWPEIEGDEEKSGMEKPIIHSENDTWAPAGAAYYTYPNGQNSLFFGGLKGQALFEIKLQENRRLKTYFKGEFGRIRDVVVGPDGVLYITTSNRDGRGTPQENDDKIIRVNPLKL